MKIKRRYSGSKEAYYIVKYPSIVIGYKTSGFGNIATRKWHFGGFFANLALFKSI